MNDFHFITENPWEGTLATDIPITFKIRHTPEYLKGTIRQEDDGSWFIQAEEKIHGVAPGQFCVVYDKDHHLCYGSGEIS
jgi:tRNA-specific 2-thiouridylase